MEMKIAAAGRPSPETEPWPEIAPPRTWKSNPWINTRLLWVTAPLLVVFVIVMKCFELEYQGEELLPGQEGKMLLQSCCMAGICLCVLLTLGNAIWSGLSLILPREVLRIEPKKLQENEDGSVTLLRCFSLRQRIALPDEMDGRPVTALAPGLLKGNRGLAYVHLPRELTAIPAEMCRGCDNLPAIVVPHRVGSIGSLAFAGCRELVEIWLPPSVEEIAPDAFRGCSERLLVHARRGSAAERLVGEMGLLCTNE